MLAGQHVTTCLLLTVTLFQWQPSIASRADPLQEQPFDSSLVLGVHPLSRSSEVKSATDLAAKLMLLDELVSLENDVTETKKKRSFPGFGSPLDRLSAGSVDLKANQRKVVELPKRRFRLPLDRIGMNRLSNSRG